MISLLDSCTLFYQSCFLNLQAVNADNVFIAVSLVLVSFLRLIENIVMKKTVVSSIKDHQINVFMVFSSMFVLRLSKVDSDETPSTASFPHECFFRCC